MSDQPYEYDDDDENDEDEQVEKPERAPGEWKELRLAKKAAEKAKKELASLKAEREFEKAGLDPADPKFGYFKKAYEGDLTAEAIRAEALKTGFIVEQVTPEPDQTPLDAQQRVSGMAGGVAVDQSDLQTAGLDQAYAEGGSEGMMRYLASQGIPISDVQ